MGETLSLAADDGHELGAYLARPEGRPKAGLVVCQEIFGVNAHIRVVTDRFANDGYLTIAPALFDRVKREVELDYTPDGMAAGRAIRAGLAWDDAMLDVAAALARAREEIGAGAESAEEAGGPGVVGYCWGGSLAWLAACRLPVAAAVGYYGGQIHEHRHEAPGCPVLLHFGLRDASIPAEDVQEIRAAHPEVPIFTYPAGHGFGCDRRDDYEPTSADQARERTLAFLAEHLG